MSVLVIAEHDNQSVKSATFNTVAAAGQIVKSVGGDIAVLVAGSNCGTAAKAAAAIAGVGRVLAVDAAHYKDQLAENMAPLVGSLAGGYTHVLLPANSFGKNLAPRVAALLDLAQVSDIVAVVSADTFVRPIYAGNALATVQSKDRIKIVTVRTTGFDAVSASGGTGAVEALQAGSDAGLSSLVGRALTKSERPELTSARVVVSGGRGMGSGDNFKILEPLADKLGAAMGASRAAVDAGFVPNDWQVGQTGDRQDRRAGALHRRGHLRRDSAPGGHEGQPRHRRDQQGRGSADIPGGGLWDRRRPVQDRSGTGERAGINGFSRGTYERIQSAPSRHALRAAGIGRPGRDREAARLRGDQRPAGRPDPRGEREVRKRRALAAQQARRQGRLDVGQRQGHHAQGLQGGVPPVRRGRLERASGARRARRAGAAEDRVDACRRDVEVGEPFFLARHDAHCGRGRGIDPARHRGTKKAIPAEDDSGQLDRHHEPHRAAGGHRPGSGADQGGPRRRPLSRLGAEDLHHLRRARSGREHRAPRARARGRCARGRARHFDVPRAEVPGERRRVAGAEERGAVRLDRAQARYPREPDRRPHIRKRGRLSCGRGEPRPRIHVHHDESRTVRGGHGRPRDLRARLPAGPRVRKGARPEPRRRGRRQGGDHHPPPRRAPHADEHEVADRGDARTVLRRRGGGGQVAEAP